MEILLSELICNKGLPDIRLNGISVDSRKIKKGYLFVSLSGSKYEGNDFIRTVVWEFPNYQKALECKNSKEYKAGWDIAKKTTKRHMQVVEGFNTE